MRDRLHLRTLMAVLLAFALGVTAVASGQETGFRIVIVTFRGCEEACEGFKDYVDQWEEDAEVTVLDVARDLDTIPAIRDEVLSLDPDLLVTWGTSVTLGMIGTVDATDPALISNIPTVFMIVADPVGAEIVTSYEAPGRTWVTGTRNRVPEATQMRVLSEYRAFDRIGVLYNDDELNAVLKAEEIRGVGKLEGFEVVTRIVRTDRKSVV